MIAENTPEWFAARVGIPTASLLADIMSSDRSGKAPGAPFARLVAEKAVEILEGSPRPTTTTWAMQRGIDLEPIALAVYAATVGFDVTKPGLLLIDSPRFGASPDAIRSDGVCVEVKCPDSPKRLWDACNGDIEEYRDQVQGQLLVTGASRCDLVIFNDRFPPEYALTVFSIERDEKRIEQIRQRVELFNEAVQRSLEEFKGRQR